MLILNLFSVPECLLAFGQCLGDPFIEFLSRHRPPIGRAHILHQGRHRLAPAFRGNQRTVGTLPSTEPADAEIQDIPGHRQVGNDAVTVHRIGRVRQGRLHGHRILAGGGGMVGAVQITSPCGQFWQEVEMVKVDLAESERLFHHLRALVQVIP